MRSVRIYLVPKTLQFITAILDWVLNDVSHRKRADADRIEALGGTDAVSNAYSVE